MKKKISISKINRKNYMCYFTKSKQKESSYYYYFLQNRIING